MNYRCQPVSADHYCLKCHRYTTDTSDSVLVASDSQDEHCGYLPSDGSKRTADLKPIVFSTYEERK